MCVYIHTKGLVVYIYTYTHTQYYTHTHIYIYITAHLYTVFIVMLSLLGVVCLICGIKCERQHSKCGIPLAYYVSAVCEAVSSCFCQQTISHYLQPL